MWRTRTNFLFRRRFKSRCTACSFCLLCLNKAVYIFIRNASAWTSACNLFQIDAMFAGDLARIRRGKHAADILRQDGTACFLVDAWQTERFRCIGGRSGIGLHRCACLQRQNRRADRYRFPFADKNVLHDSFRRSGDFRHHFVCLDFDQRLIGLDIVTFLHEIR